MTCLSPCPHGEATRPHQGQPDAGALGLLTLRGDDRRPADRSGLGGFTRNGRLWISPSGKRLQGGRRLRLSLHRLGLLTQATAQGSCSRWGAQHSGILCDLAWDKRVSFLSRLTEGPGGQPNHCH